MGVASGAECVGAKATILDPLGMILSFLGGVRRWDGTLCLVDRIEKRWSADFADETCIRAKGTIPGPLDMI